MISGSIKILNNLLGNSLQNVQHLLPDKAFSRDNPQISSQICAYFTDVRRLIWVTPGGGSKVGDLKGPPVLRIMAMAKPRTNILSRPKLHSESYPVV
jgi:hypothetical protein